MMAIQRVPVNISRDNGVLVVILPIAATAGTKSGDTIRMPKVDRARAGADPPRRPPGPLLDTGILTSPRNSRREQQENYIWWRTNVRDGEEPCIFRAGAQEGGWSMAKKKAAKKKKK